MARSRTRSNDEILDAAIAFVCQHGAESLTFASLAHFVGLAPATLVQRFGGKRQLLAEAAAHCLANSEAIFTTAAAREQSPLAALRAALQGAASAVASADEYARGLVFFSTSLADPKLSLQLRDNAGSMRGSIKQLLDASVTAKELSPCDTEELALSIQTAYEGAIVTWVMYRQGPVTEWVSARINAVVAPYLIK